MPKLLEDPRWKETVQEEMHVLDKNKTQELVELPPRKKTVGCKWVFTMKFKYDGIVNKYKARFVANGFMQTYGIDH